MELQEALAQTFRMAGLATLDEPRKLLGYVMDLCNQQTREFQVFKNNCDEELCGPFARVAHMTSPQSSDLAAATRQAELHLRDDRFISNDAAHTTAQSIAGAVAGVLGLSAPSGQSVGVGAVSAYAEPTYSAQTMPTGSMPAVAPTQQVPSPAPSPVQPSAQPAAAPKKAPIGLVVGALLIAVIAIGALVFVLVSSNISQASSTSSLTAVQQQSGTGEQTMVSSSEASVTPEASSSEAEASVAPETSSESAPAPTATTAPDPEPTSSSAASNLDYGPATFASTSYLDEVWDFPPYFDRMPATVHSWMGDNGFWVEGAGSDCAAYLSEYGTQFVFEQSTVAPENTAGYRAGADHSPLADGMRWRVMRVHFWGEGLDYAIDKCHLTGES